MLFYVSRKHSFLPEYSFRNGNFLEVVDSTKLLGVYLSSDLSWNYNTSQITRKAMSRLWLIWRMKSLKIDTNIIYDYYVKEIRPVLEYAVPVWSSGISLRNSDDIEKVQTIVFRIILGSSYCNYPDACNFLNS